MKSSTVVQQRFNIAILALGGQGGGVLVDWLVRLAESHGWLAQATSVAGVAQRTGATIYYLEIMQLAPATSAPAPMPVMALMPVPGTVDIVIAAELMEAGRALERGLISKERSTVITSTHRTYAVHEKIALTSGISDAAQVLALVQAGAKRVVCDDMQHIALQAGSVISSSLFGALAGSLALPFTLDAYEQVVMASGVGVETSLAALRHAAHSVQSKSHLQPESLPGDPMLTAARALLPKAHSSALQTLLERIRRSFPEAAWNMLGEGVARLCDYQDLAYAHAYLDRIQALLDQAGLTPELKDALAQALAQWLAVAMSYDDVIRVADLKIRSERSARIRGEVRASANAIVGIEDYFHPRLEEVLSLMRPGMAAWVTQRRWLSQWLERKFCQGQRIATHSVSGYLKLRGLAALRRTRHKSLRHQQEMAHIAQWLDAVQHCLKSDAALAIELVLCRRLIKGYSDTHTRGSQRFDTLLQAALALCGQASASQDLARLRQAAFKDEHGHALAQELRALGLDLAPD